MIHSSVLYKLSYGMYIIVSGDEMKFNGQICNTSFQITSDPMILAISVNKENFTNECIQKARKMTLSILDTSAPFAFIGRFGFRSGRTMDKLEGIKTKTGVLGIPVILENTCGYIECDVIDEKDLGTHMLYFGKVVEGEILNDRTPMTYEFYHKELKGKSPKTAPTYIQSAES